MQEQLITFETAKLASEKGYSPILLGEVFRKSLPTQSLLQKWLRDRPTPIIVTPSTDFVSWEVEVRTPDEDPEVYWGTVGEEGRWFNSYEEALEAGLQEALKLI